MLAGAGGSSKTARVLTHRIAHLVVDLGVCSWRIVASPSRTRQPQKCASAWASSWAGTCAACGSPLFIACACASCVPIAERLLRTRIHHLRRLRLKEPREAHHGRTQHRPKALPRGMVRNRISKAKNELVTPGVRRPLQKDPTAQVVGRIYKCCKNACAPSMRSISTSAPLRISCSEP